MEQVKTRRSRQEKEPRLAYRGPRQQHRGTRNMEPRQAYRAPKNVYWEPRPAYSETRPAFREPRTAFREPRPAFRETRTAYSEPRKTWGSRQFRANEQNTNSSAQKHGVSADQLRPCKFGHRCDRGINCGFLHCNFRRISFQCKDPGGTSRR